MSTFQEEEDKEQQFFDQLEEIAHSIIEEKEGKLELKALAQSVVDEVCHLKDKTFDEICKIIFSKVTLADEDFDDFCDFTQRALSKSSWIEREEDDITQGFE